MGTIEERMQILSMIEKGQITAEEGSKLLDAIERAGARATVPGSASQPKWFRVRVTDMASGKRKVNVNIPLGLVNVGIKMGARFAPDIEGLDVQEIMRSIQEGVQGKIIDVEDDEDGEHVEIFVE